MNRRQDRWVSRKLAFRVCKKHERTLGRLKDPLLPVWNSENIWKRWAFSTLLLRTLSLILSTAITAPNLVAQTPLSLDRLPESPTELKTLSREGQVRFVFGTENLESVGLQTLPELPTEMRNALQSQKQTNDRSVAPENRLSAITTYRVEFRFARQTTWNWNPLTRTMTIEMRARLQSWKPIHTIWFRRLPELDDFWDSPLVLHEFDHVQLSTDPAMEKRFATILRQGNREEIQLSGDQKPSEELATVKTDQWVQQMFQEIVELVDIRYRELDQITLHGRRELPPASPLYKTLRPNTAINTR